MTDDVDNAPAQFGGDDMPNADELGDALVEAFADRCIAHALEHNAPQGTCAECDSARSIALKRIGAKS